jgi:hypothetical protein
MKIIFVTKARRKGEYIINQGEFAMNDQCEVSAVPSDVNDLHLSFHALARLNQRGIGFNDLQAAKSAF